MWCDICGSSGAVYIDPSVNSSLPTQTICYECQNKLLVNKGNCIYQPIDLTAHDLVDLLNQVSYNTIQDAYPVLDFNNIDHSIKSKLRDMSHKLIDELFESHNDWVLYTLVELKKSQSLATISITEDDVERIRYDNIK